MSALTPDERKRYDTLRSRIAASVSAVTESDTSLRLRVDDSVPLPEIAEWMALEHRCCPFLGIDLRLQPDGDRSIELGGSPAIKDFLRSEFGYAVGSRR
jgi:hypothetical protein